MEDIITGEWLREEMESHDDMWDMEYEEQEELYEYIKRKIYNELPALISEWICGRKEE